MVDRHAATAKLDGDAPVAIAAAMLEDDLVDGVATSMSSSPGGAVGENDRTRRGSLPPAGTSAHTRLPCVGISSRTTSQMPLRQSR